MCDIDNFWQGGVNNGWLGGVEFYREDYPPYGVAR